MEKRTEVNCSWTEHALDCPYKGIPVEGHHLTIRRTGDAQAIWWVDTVRFEPVWQQ